NITNNARIDNPVTCRNLLDHVTPPGYWAALRNQHDAGFLDSFNINSAQHVCMVFELRLRYEHDIVTREKYEKKFTNSVAVVQQRDAEIVDLKARLEKSEAEAAEVVELRKRMSDLEVVVVVKVGEVATLNTQNAGLLENIFALEMVRRELDGKVTQLTSDCDGLRDQVVGKGKMREEFVSQQDVAKRRFSERDAELDARIADVRRDIDNDLYPHMLIAIAGRRWVVGHGFHLAVHKCAHSVECRSALGKVISMAINKEINGKYVAAVFEFENVSFPLLDELEGLKDSPLALIMSALTLKDDHGNTEFLHLSFVSIQPSPSITGLPCYYFESGFIDREMLLSDAIPAIREFAKRKRLCPPLSSTLGRASSSAPPHDSSLGVADYQVSTLVLSSDGGSANQPLVVQQHDDLFDTFVLDKSGDA
ncbi:hypothetical protein Tco_1413961, partial [Tanacetum coccineum]